MLILSEDHCIQKVCTVQFCFYDSRKRKVTDKIDLWFLERQEGKEGMITALGRQSVDKVHLLKQEDLSSYPQYTCKRPGTAMCVCNHRIGRIQQKQANHGGQMSTQSSQNDKFQDQRETLSQNNKMENHRGRQQTLTSGPGVCILMHTPLTHTQSQTLMGEFRE